MEGCPRLALGLLEQEIIQLGRRGVVAVCSYADPHLAPDFQALGVNVIPLNWRPRGFIGIGLRAFELLKACRPSGVICYSVGVHVTIAMACRSLRIPFVLHIGNSPPTGNRTVLNKIRLQMFAGRPFVGAYAACSEHVRREATREYWLPTERVTTVPNGIALPSFLRVRQQKNQVKNGAALRIGMVGSFELHKDQDSLIEAVALLVRREENVRLRLVGTGSRESYLREKTDRLGLSDVVEWAGTTTDVPAELANMDIFAYSVKGEEGQGIALVEALAAGLPVVASDVGACREVLNGGRFGVLVPLSDPAAWADAILAARSLTPAPPDYLERYDIQKTILGYVNLLTSGS